MYYVYMTEIYIESSKRYKIPHNLSSLMLSQTPSLIQSLSNSISPKQCFIIAQTQ